MLLTVTSTVDAAAVAAGGDAPDASDLGYLLHKHPGRVQTFTLPFGVATVFYPEAEPERCTAALLLEVDPIGLVRGKKGRKGAPQAFALAQYVNDRPYAASSLLAVAIGRVYGTALSGRCDARPEAAATPLRLHLHIPALPARASAGWDTGGAGGAGSLAGADLVRALFEPLGWEVDARETPLAGDAAGFDWGAAPYVDTHLRGEMRLADALSHLYVLLPVLDDTKHYWVGPDEVDKLIRHGGGWLETHPLRDLITRRYLAAQRTYVRDATARLDELDDQAETVRDEPEDAGDVDDTDDVGTAGSGGSGGAGDDGGVRGASGAGGAESVAAATDAPAAETVVAATDTNAAGSVAVANDTGVGESVAATRTLAPEFATTPAPATTSGTRPWSAPLKALRREAVLDALHEVRARRVVDLGCGEGYYLQALLADATFTEIVGVDVGAGMLARAEKRLGLARLGDRQRERLTLRQSSATYRDDTLTGYDAVLLVEVIEHVEPDRLPSLERSVFGYAKPRSVIVTTPDRDYNVHYDLGEHEMRHPDHRFEWNRPQFEAWAHGVAERNGYAVTFRPVGATTRGGGGRAVATTAATTGTAATTATTAATPATTAPAGSPPAPTQMAVFTKEHSS